MSIAPAIFTLQQDSTSGNFKILCSVDGVTIVVQTNIRTREKAETALKIWREREKKRVGA